MALTTETTRAIEACYDALLEPEWWPGALQKLADALGATSCVIGPCDPEHPFGADRRGQPMTALLSRLHTPSQY